MGGGLYWCCTICSPSVLAGARAETKTLVYNISSLLVSFMSSFARSLYYIHMVIHIYLNAADVVSISFLITALQDDSEFCSRVMCCTATARLSTPIYMLLCVCINAWFNFVNRWGLVRRHVKYSTYIQVRAGLARCMFEYICLHRTICN